MKRIFCLTLICLSLLCSCQEGPAAASSASSSLSNSASEPSDCSSDYDTDKISPINLVLSYSGPTTSANGYWATQYKQRVERLSGGKITIDIYSDSTLGSDLDVLLDCQYGTVDIQIASPASLVSSIPEAAIFDIPFLFQDLTTARTALSDPVFFDYLSQAYVEKGIVLLSLTDQGFRSLSSNVPIQSLADFEGLTIRCMYNQHHTDFWGALGVQAVSMDIADTYLALQKGGVQGQENTYGEIYNRKFYEVQKYITNSNHLLYVGGMHISKITWDSLSSTAQDVLRKAADECAQILPVYVDQANLYDLKQMLQAGSHLIDFDQIPGLREQCLDLTYEVAYDSISQVTGSDILDLWCSLAQNS